MAITIKQYTGQAGTFLGTDNFKSLRESLYSSYNWTKTESQSVDGGRDEFFYLSDTFYLKLHSPQLSTNQCKIYLYAGKTGSTETLLLGPLQIIGSSGSLYFYFSWAIAKVGDNLALRITSTQNGDYDKSLNFNIFIGDFKLGETTIKGIVSVSSNNLIVVTPNGGATVSALGTTITPDRKAILIPVTNTITGDVSSNIFMIRYSPIKEAIMEVEGQGVFLCGKTLALKD